MQRNHELQGKEQRVDRNIKLTLRLSQEESDRLREYAGMEHMSQSDFLRTLILQREGKVVPAEVRDEIKKLSYEINRIGNNINQLTRGTHERRYMSEQDRKDLRDAVQRVEDTLKAIMRQQERLG